jgi:DNA repair protein RadA/Sms
MAKSRSEYVCQNCGYSQVGWSGRCPNCDTWGSLVETLVQDASSKSKKTNSRTPTDASVQSLKEVATAKIHRVTTNIPELDRVLGGGLVPGQVILLAGEPGIGKSTILLQVCSNLETAFYASGEESAIQIKIRAQRLRITGEHIDVLESTDIDNIIDTIKAQNEENKAKIIVIDSIQTMATTDLTGLSGSVGQIRETTFRIVRLAKSLGIPVVIVGHVTKEGTVAGPALLAHLVDTVLWFEGEKNMSLRVIRAYKNRFGPTDEVGIFEMQETGLASISDPSSLFISETTEKISGTAKAVVMEGTRPVIVEIQSLIIPSKLPTPRRVAQGIDAKRVELILAVLARRCGIDIGSYDVFVNAVGGIVVKDPGVDMAIALALASSKKDIALSKDMVCIGEVGLLGEVRKAFSQDNRIKEAKRLGYKTVITNQADQFLHNIVKKFLTK